MLVAQYPGKCSFCGGPIKRGEEFNWGSERGQRVHADADTCEYYDDNGIDADDRPAVTIEQDGRFVAPAMSTYDNAVPATFPLDYILNNTTPPAVVERALVWSANQDNIFDFMVNGNGNLLVDAKPGSGKTSTAKEGALRYKAANPQAKIIMLAFNANIAAELKAKMKGTGIEASTFHSFWYRVVCKNRTILREPTDSKVRQIGNLLVKKGELDRATAEDYLTGACQLVSKAKGVAGIGALVEDKPKAWLDLVDRFDITFEGSNENDGIELARRLLRLSNEDTTTVDFDDMIYLPTLYGWKPERFDLVIVDEAQDTNPIRRHLIKPMLAENGRLVAVGDLNQSIYSFAGADSDAMDLIAAEYRCARLPLNESFRCPRLVVAEAQRLVSDIISAENAPDGIVEDMPAWLLKDFATEQTSAVLCRNTAPIVTLAYKLLGQRIPCKVLGRDIGQGLENLIHKMRAVDIEDLIDRLQDYEQIETARLNKRNEERKAQAVSDKVSSILAAISGMPEVDTVDGLIAAIRAVFAADSTSGVLVLSTVHKAKGREWKRVFILDRELMPSAYAKTEEQLTQERNVEYVAITRAQQRLTYISSKGLK